MNATEATAPLPAWAAPDLFSIKPDDAAYGYRLDGANHPATPDELVDRVRAEEPRVELVWTPESTNLVPPAEVDFLIEAVRERTHADLVFNLKNSLLVLGIWSAVVLLGYYRGSSTELSLTLLLLLGIAPAIQDWWGLRNVRRSTGYIQNQATIFRYQIWLGDRRIITTWLLAGCIIVVGIGQIFSPHSSIAAAGLVKEIVRSGQEPWRMLTCTLMHGGLLHFAFNFVALLALGRLIEVHSHPMYLPIVFLLSAFCGSLMSVWLMPHTPSVGASGGLLGMIGFLAILGIRRRRIMPPGFLKAIILSIALTAGAGVLARNTIDNAAHFGGLIGGLVLGFIYVSRQYDEVRLTPTRPTYIAGVLATVTLVFVTAATIFRLLRPA